MQNLIPVNPRSELAGDFAVDSLDLAQGLGKRHDNVLRIIDKLCVDMPDESNRLKLEEITYTDSKGRTQRKYLLTHQSIILLMSRMQDSTKWFLKLSELFISMKDKLIEQQKQLLSAKNKESKKLQQPKEKIETEYGTSYKRKIPNDEKTILLYSGVLEEHGIEIELDGKQKKPRRIPTAGLPLLAVADLMLAHAQSVANGWEEKLPRLTKWNAAVHIAIEAGEQTPSPKDYGLKTTYDFLFESGEEEEEI